MPPRPTLASLPALTRAPAGFTLVELLIVLALATLLLTLLPPLVASALPGVELKAAARQTAASLRLAREAAVRAGEERVIVIDLEANRITLDGFRPVRIPPRAELRLETAVSELLDEHRGGIRFFPDGSSTGGRIVLAVADRGYQVGVHWLTGRVRLAAWERD